MSWSKGLVDRRDERIAAMDVRATAAAGLVLIVVTLAAFVIDLLRGNDGMPYAWLAGVGGVAYIVALAVLRVRG